MGIGLSVVGFGRWEDSGGGSRAWDVVCVVLENKAAMNGSSVVFL